MKDKIEREKNESKLMYFFCGGRGLNPRPCIFYALSLSTELSSRGHILCISLM